MIIRYSADHIYTYEQSRIIANQLNEGEKAEDENHRFTFTPYCVGADAYKVAVHDSERVFISFW